jgi:hypothetical protein
MVLSAKLLIIKFMEKKHQIFTSIPTYFRAFSLLYSTYLLMVVTVPPAFNWPLAGFFFKPKTFFSNKKRKGKKKKQKSVVQRLWLFVS